MDTGNADGKGPFPASFLPLIPGSFAQERKVRKWKATEDHGVAEQV
jgi:hypothetical protein